MMKKRIKAKGKHDDKIESKSNRIQTKIEENDILTLKTLEFKGKCENKNELNREYESHFGFTKKNYKSK